MSIEPHRKPSAGGSDDWWSHSEALWREAHQIVDGHPDLDPGDVYHALRCLELSPAERLHRGLTRVRPRPHTN